MKPFRESFPSWHFIDFWRGDCSRTFLHNSCVGCCVLTHECIHSFTKPALVAVHLSMFHRQSLSQDRSTKEASVHSSPGESRWTSSRAMVVTHTFNSSNQGAGSGRSLHSRSAWPTEEVPWNPGLYKETLDQKIKPKSNKEINKNYGVITENSQQWDPIQGQGEGRLAFWRKRWTFVDTRVESVEITQERETNRKQFSDQRKHKAGKRSIRENTDDEARPQEA